MVAVVATFLKLLNPGNEVRAYPPNFADKFSKTAGDIELREGGRVLSAIECKDRPLNPTDITHGIRKAHEKGVGEYIFVTGFGIGPPEIDPGRLGEEKGIDSSYASIDDILICLGMGLNQKRRASFVEILVQTLSEMHRLESAKTAASLWNEITEAEALSGQT